MKNFNYKKHWLAGAGVILGIAVIGTIILNGGFASTKSAYNVQASSAHIYALDTKTQLKRVSVNVTITNDSSSDLQISPGLQMHIQDTAGMTHPMTADYLAPGVVIGGTLKPGAKWSNSVDFDLASNETPAKFIFQPDAVSSPTEIGL